VLATIVKNFTKPLKEKVYFLSQDLTCGLDEPQVKDAKANYTYSKNKSPQNLRKQEKTIKKR